jgi:hypothetical protein
MRLFPPAKVLPPGVALVLACSSSMPAQVPSPISPAAFTAPVTREAPRAQFVVDAMSLQQGLTGLPVDEQAEQIADWAAAGVLAEVLRQQPDVLLAVGRLPPLRRDGRYEILGIHEYGRARRLIVDANLVVLLLPVHEPEQDLVLARLADLTRADLGHIPERFHVYSYAYEAAAGRIAIQAGRRLAGTELFSPAFGYIEAAIANSGDLGRWLKQVDTLTYFTAKDGGVVLGGRAGRNSNRIELEDVATLYQAQLGQTPHIRQLHQLQRDHELIVLALNRVVAVVKANVARYNQRGKPDCEAFDQAWRALGRLFGDADAPGPVSCKASALEIMNAETALMDRLSPWAQQVLRDHGSEMDRVTAAAPPSPGIGFSLDPQWEVQSLERDVAQLKKDPQPILAEAQALAAKADGKATQGASYVTQTAIFLVDALRRARVIAITPLTGQMAAILDDAVSEARAHKSRTVEHLLRLERILAGMEQSREPETQVMVALLRFVEARDRIQCARYEGALAGTRVGMQLFYTDLQAKLWAGLDYQGSAPKQAIPGMPTLWSAPGNQHSTRIWFGPRSDRMARWPDFTSMIFAPVATRIYSASSVAGDPVHEETPADPVRHVLDFWTHHYAQLARHDGRFAFVNEVQKWSTLANLWVLWNALPELERQPVDRRQVFDRWASKEPGLRLPEDIGLLPRARWVSHEPAWECMDQLAAAKDEGEQHFTISGGHSLADFASPRALPAQPAGFDRAPLPGNARAEKRTDDTHTWVHSSNAAVAANKKTAQHAAHDATTSREGNVITTVHKAPDGTVDVSRIELTDAGASLSAPGLDQTADYVRAHDRLMASDLTKAMKKEAAAKAAQPDSRQIQLKSLGHRGSDADPPGPVRLVYQTSWRTHFRQTGREALP